MKHLIDLRIALGISLGVVLLILAVADFSARTYRYWPRSSGPWVGGQSMREGLHGWQGILLLVVAAAGLLLVVTAAIGLQRSGIALLVTLIPAFSWLALSASTAVGDLRHEVIHPRPEFGTYELSIPWSFYVLGPACWLAAALLTGIVLSWLVERRSIRKSLVLIPA